MSFKFNEEVVFYEGGKRRKGLVLDPSLDMNGLMLVGDAFIGEFRVHEKQCRRLKPKRRMECWVNWYPSDGIQSAKVFLSESEAARAGAADSRQIHFREVISKNKGEGK